MSVGIGCHSITEYTEVSIFLLMKITEFHSANPTVFLVTYPVTKRRKREKGQDATVRVATLFNQDHKLF